MALLACTKHSQFPLTYLVYSLKISVFLVTVELLLEKAALMENRKCRFMDVLVTGAEITHFETDSLSFFIELIMYFFFPLKEILTLRKTKAAKLNAKIHE